MQSAATQMAYPLFLKMAKSHIFFLLNCAFSLSTGRNVSALRNIRLWTPARIRNVTASPYFDERVCMKGPYARVPIAAPASAIPDARARRLLKYLVRITSEGNKPRLDPRPQITPYVTKRGWSVVAKELAKSPAADTNEPAITTTRLP